MHWYAQNLARKIVLREILKGRFECGAMSEKFVVSCIGDVRNERLLNYLVRRPVVEALEKV